MMENNIFRIQEILTVRWFLKWSCTLNLIPNTLVTFSGTIEKLPGQEMIAMIWTSFSLQELGRYLERRRKDIFSWSAVSNSNYEFQILWRSEFFFFKFSTLKYLSTNKLYRSGRRSIFPEPLALPNKGVSWPQNFTAWVKKHGHSDFGVGVWFWD